MLIVEELLLLGLEPRAGTVVDGAKRQLLVGLAGALVAELGLHGAVRLEGGRFVPAGPAPGPALLADTHGALGPGSGRRPADQLRRLDRRVQGLWPRVVGGLVAQGVLGRRRDRVLLWHVTRHPVLRPDLRDDVVQRVRRAAAGDGPLDPSTAVLLALSGPSRLLEVVAPERAARAHAQARIDAAAELVPAADVVREVLAEAQAAVTAAALAATAGSASAASGGT